MTRWVGLCHRPETFDAEVLGPTRVRLRLRAPAGVRRAWVVARDPYAPESAAAASPMTRAGAWDGLELFEAQVEVPTRRLAYRFHVRDAAGSAWLGEGGVALAPTVAPFRLPYLFQELVHAVPRWAREAVFYHIFVDRYARSPGVAPRPDWSPWGDRPTVDAVFGGSLRGILEHAGDLEELGVGAVQLTPIFAAPSNHKYDTTDFYRIDPAFGDETDLRALVDGLHRRGIRVILDGVFNHVGAGFAPFADALSRGEASPYRGWFTWRDDRVGYETFATGVGSMPKLRTSESAVADYLVEVARHWMRKVEIDGWRLDVANEVSPGFWRRFVDTVRTIRPDAFLAGEIWHGAEPWLRPGGFDAVTDYVWREAVVDYLARETLDAEGFAAALTRRRAMGRIEAGMTLVSSHDTPRFATLASGRLRTLVQALALELTLPGIPVIFYGDEVGMEGGEDPDCRRTMVFEPGPAGRAVRLAVRRLIALRRRHRELGGPDFQWIAVDGARDRLAFRRPLPEGDVIVGLSRRSEGLWLRIPPAALRGVRSVHDVLADAPVTVVDGRVPIPPDRGLAVLECSRNDGAAARPHEEEFSR